MNDNDIKNLIEWFKSKEKTKNELSGINDTIKKYIKKFHQEKNNYFSELESIFIDYKNSNYDKFNDLCNEIIKDKNLTQLFFSIFKKKIFVNFIFVGFKNINSDEIKKQITNSNLKQINFDIIVAADNNMLLEKLKVKHENNLININQIFNKIPNHIPNLNNYHYIIFNMLDNKFQYNFFSFNYHNIYEAMEEFLNDFYNKNRTNFNKDVILNKENIFDKIEYDWDYLINEKDIQNKIINSNKINETIIFTYNEKSDQDNKILEIGKEYYNKLIKYVKNLLNALVRKKPNYDEMQRLLELFNNNVKENNYIISFKDLIENWKCKDFYHYYLTYFLLAQFSNNIFKLSDMIKLEISS